MSRDPFKDIPEDVDDDFLDDEPLAYEVNGSAQPSPEDSPEEKTVEEVTKGTPPKDIFGKLIKFLIPTVAVLLGIWFLMPQEHRKPKEREEVAVDQRIQEANANSMLKELQEQSDEQAAMKKESEPESGKDTPSIPVVDGNGNVTGTSRNEKEIESERELRESEIRGSQLEALGNFKLFGEEGIISKTGSLLGIGSSSADSEIAAHQRRTEETLNRSHQIEERREKRELLNSIRNPNEKFQQTQPQGDYINETVHQQMAASKTVVQQGTVVRTVLLSAVNSDMPGSITAMVTSDIYDSTYGRKLMIPKGSKLIGSYNSNVAIGQDRVMIAMTRMILPDGTWISLAATPATDRIGQSGLEADVNNHFWRMFGASFMIGAASMLLPDDQNTISTANINGTGDLSAGSVAAMALVETVQTLMERNKHIAPTLTIKPGTEFSFIVAKDMVMTPYNR